MDQKSVFYTRKFILLFISLFFVFVPPVYAVDVTLQWNPNSDSNLAGYRVFSREEGQSYNYVNPSLEVAKASCNINNLDENKTYYFVVRAFDTEGFESSDSNEVYLEAATTLNNQPPIAVIAKDYIDAISGTTVTLDGSRSTDADDGIASYHWSQVDGTPVILSDHNSEVATFTAPETDQYGSNLTFQLMVTDFGGLQSTADCFVYVMQNVPPTLNSVTITGASQVNESSGAKYMLTANYSDGSSTDVTGSAGWSENSAFAAINTGGLLTTSDVSSDTAVTIQATYTYNGITETATKGITITDVIVPGAPSSLNALIRVNAGGGEYTDGSGNFWSADYGYNTGRIASTSDPISGTTDDVLYKSERWNPSTSPNLTYSFDLPNGDYTVNLYFAEIYSGASFIGGRVFDVSIEGMLVLVNLDIFTEVGYDAALIKTIDVTVTDGQLNIEFLKGIENPKISAIEVISPDMF